MHIRKLLLLILVLLVTGGICILPVAANTTQLHIVKYADDGTTILNETTKTYQWLESNLPVLGDGSTHYYNQGPVFVDNTDPVVEQELRWNPAESVSVQEKDNGAVKGTNLKDLCDLVGGMNAGETLKLRASDGFSKTFAYANVYEYPARQGPMGITWYKDGQYVDSGYSDGLKLVFFADDSTNPWGIHAMGNYDWHESAAPEYWYYYSSGSEQYPTTTGLSVKYISDVLIYSNDPAPEPAPFAQFEATPVTGVSPLNVQFTDQTTGGTAPLQYAWDFNNDGTIDNTTKNPLYSYTSAGTYSVNLTVTDAEGDWGNRLRNNYITVNNPSVDTLYDGTVTLTAGETFTKQAYNNVTGGLYTVNRTTPLGALDKVATLQGLAYNVTDKRWQYDQVLLLDDIGQYLNKKPGVWNAYVNGVSKDGYGNHLNGLNVIELANDDQVNFYYAPNKDPNPVLNATAVVKIKVNIPAPGPVVDTIYDGTVTLTAGETFTKQAYNNATGGLYTINRTTPLGALDKVVTLQGLAYNVTDKRWQYDQVLLLDDIGQYLNKKPGVWNAYVNGVSKDGYGNHANGLNVIELANNDQVNFYYAPNKDPNPVLNATAVVKIKVDIPAPGPVVDTIYDGTVTLTAGETFTKQAYNNATGGLYTISRTTPLGALDKVATLQGFTYNVTDSQWSNDQVLLLDDLGQYLRKKPNYWYAYVNGESKDGYKNHANGLNVIELANNDQVNFYYAPNKDPNPVLNATAVVKIKVNTGSAPPAPDWTLSLSGAKNTPVSKTLFDQGLACPTSGHQKYWTDSDGNVWGGVPLWVLVAMVDDNPDVGPDHYNFNDSIAAQGYSIKVISGDGWDTTLASADIARNSSYLVANTFNGQPLAKNLTSGKLSWPLHLKGAAIFGGQQVGNITRIELTGLPKPATEWKLTLEGEVTDTITQSYFIEAIACHHNVTWTDGSGNVYEGVSLWDLAGAVDDIETSSHYTFNDTRAAMGYTIRVSAADEYNATFTSTSVARNDGYFLAYKMNGAPLTGSSAPLKLVGSSTTSGAQRVGNVAKISLEGLPDQYPVGNWQLKLNGKISAIIPQGEFEYWASCHSATYTDANGNVYTGVPLWRLMGWVDDRIPHGQNGFNDAAATAGYKVIVKAGDGYAKEFTSTQIGKNNNFIVAYTLNGTPLPTDGAHPPYPLRLVGSGAIGGNSVGNLAEIQLTDFQIPVEVPKLHILKYASDGKTVINETFVDYNYMENNLPVIGDGTTVYKFEGLTLNSSNLWDPEETYPGGYKISNAVKGTRVKDLAELVGGMGSGTTITFVANDGFETTLPYSTIYTNPAVQARQGDAIIAWWGDGQYVPLYGDGMRLFFMPDGDHVYGQWDMHETLPSAYWRYNFQDGIQYPSAAGLSAKYITTIKVYSSPESEWTLELDGRDIGGVNYNVSKPYLEEAIACQFGADHKATYTDSKGRVWEGMPLWFFAGFVDDADQHSPNAFNNTLAQGGYNIIVTGTDGSSTSIDSKEFIRSSNYIIANSLNGTHIDESDDNWPLRLTGANISGSESIKGVKSIHLVRILVVPIASFNADNNSGTAPLMVLFNDTSSGTVTSWNWSLGDGSFSSLQDPVHTYTSAGIYTVSLNATNAAGSNIKTVANFITVNPAVIAPVANLNGTPTTGTAPLTVRFMDDSINDPTVWLWEFGDGSPVDATVQDPVHTYTSPGIYTVSLNATNAAGSNTHTAANYITVNPAVIVPVANFNGTPTTGTAPLTVRFMDDSINDPTVWLWEFGDGSLVDATVQDPVHTYTSAGIYTVSLNATNAAGSNIKTVANFITVNPAVITPVTAFSANKTEGDKPFTVKFTDASTNAPTSWLWDFGDRGTSTAQDPIHQYTVNGTFTVNLTATNSAGSNSSVRTGYVTVIAPVTESNNFGVTGVQTTTTGNVQNASITTGTNVTTSGNVVTVTNSTGWSSLAVTMNGTPEMSGTTINGTIQSVKAVTEPVTAPIASAGTPTVQIALDLSEMPGATAAITQTITKDPDATAQSSFSLFATSEGKQIDEVAYTINIVKTNLANAGDGGIIKSATLTMTVSPAWVAAHGGIDHIMVLRRAEDGTTQILVPQLTGTDAYGNYILTIFSPNGLSTFSVASVSSISTGPATSSGSSVSSGYSSGYSSSGTTSDSSDTSSFTSRSVTSSGAQAGQAASFTFAQAVSADKPVGIRIVSLVPTRTLGATDLIVQDAAIGTIAETLGRPVAGVEEITPVGISSSAIDHATITFAVSGSWLTAHNIAPSNIVLVHNTNGQWVDLPTTFSEQVGNTYYFTATTSGFSLFAVSVKKTAVASLAPAVPTISDPGIQSAASPVYAEAATALSVDNKPVAAQTTVAPVTVPESSPYFPLPTILIGVTGIVIVVIGIVIGKRWWIRRQNPGQFEDTKFLR